MSVDTQGQINFYNCNTKDGSLPWMDATPKLGLTGSNYDLVPTRLPIYDVRGKENQFQLDMNGFEFHKYNGNIHEPFENNSPQTQIYYDDIMSLLKNRLGAAHVVIFGHVIRFRGPLRPAEQCDLTHKNPVFYPHVDNNPDSARFKVKEVLGDEEAEKVLHNHFQIINVWKPLGPNPIVNTPLTICDYQTLDINHDIHVSEVRGSNNSVAIYIVSNHAKDNQKWYYTSNMKSDEMFVFKIFDSNPNVAQFGAHTAFINDSMTAKSNLQQCSVELRCLVFYD